MQNALHDIETVAKMLGLSARTVRAMVRERKIEATRVSERRCFISQKAVDEYLERCTVPAAAD